MKSSIAIVLVAALMQGCAVNMAATGQNGPDMRVVERQQTREDIERMLGLPVQIIEETADGSVELYRVQARTEPSVKRAVGHATLDVFTFGIWELVGGPLEGYAGRRQNVIVTYDSDDRVVSVEGDRQPGNARIAQE